ncbi:MAG: bis(5'-nucleosyl)-tetraphosphatase (symmetrical) YqeK [Chloroflexota bacterium]|nr:bis(5'-nucleosyl)-tetraphosphatase (symmetrical) YqeK [Chloroflexota bacterium]
MQPQPDAGQIATAVESRIQQRVAALPAGLRAHIVRAQQVARELAPFHNVDPDRAALGILAHDVARAMPGRELIARATRFRLPIISVEENMPLLLHGPVGAEILRVEDGLAAQGDEADLYQAVYWHTTFHPTLVDELGKVVFLADKLDPNKRKRIPYQPEIMDLALENLDAAILEFLRRQVQDLTAAGREVHPVMLEARDALALRVSGTLP